MCLAVRSRRDCSAGPSSACGEGPGGLHVRGAAAVQRVKLLFKELSLFLQSTGVEELTPSGIVFGHWDFKGVIKVKEIISQNLDPIGLVSF